jgi:hypothetical protein
VELSLLYNVAGVYGIRFEVDDLLQSTLRERDVNVGLARWFFGLTTLFATMGLCTSAQAQVVVQVGHPHHYRHHHHRHYRHHYDRR